MIIMIMNAYRGFKIIVVAAENPSGYTFSLTISCFFIKKKATDYPDKEDIL